MQSTQTSLTPHITVKGGKAAIEFYKKAFGAEDMGITATAPDSDLIMHAGLRIGGSVLYLSDEFPSMGSHAPTEPNGAFVLNLDTPDATALYNQAVAAGATIKMPLQDTFWGARYGQIADPFNHMWAIHQQLNKPSDAEIAKGAEAFYTK
jgi:uncharacterized glyoxalase superfamily protein PhnB